MIFKTANLTLRPWKEEDAECLYHFAKNPNVGPIAGWPPHESVDDSLNIIKTVFAKKETYAVVKDNIPIGCVGLLFHPDTNHWWGEGAVELGYWIAEEHWGNGYAAEASKAIINHAFHDLGISQEIANFAAVLCGGYLHFYRRPFWAAMTLPRSSPWQTTRSFRYCFSTRC